MQITLLDANNKVVWAPRWTEKQIAKGRVREAEARETCYSAMPRCVSMCNGADGHVKA